MLTSESKMKTVRADHHPPELTPPATLHRGKPYPWMEDKLRTAKTFFSTMTSLHTRTKRNCGVCCST